MNTMNTRNWRRVSAGALMLVCWTVTVASAQSQNSLKPRPTATNVGQDLPQTGRGVGGVRDGVLVDNNAILKYFNDTEIPAQADGIITDITAEEGESILESNLLLELDTRLADAELLVATRQLQASEIKANDQSNMEYNRLSLEVAKKQLEMFQNLFNKGALSNLELDKNKLEADKARLALQVAKTQNQTDALEAGVNEAKKHAAEVQIQLRKINAPFNGVVAELKKHKHDWVRVGEPIVRLVGMEKLNVIGRLQVDELQGPAYLLENSDALAIITLNQAISDRDAQEIRISGKLNFVSPVQDSEGRYRVKMQIMNQKIGESWVFREGMQVRLEVTQRTQ